MKYLRIGIYLLLVFFLFFPFLVLPRLIKVKKIECYNQYGLCSEEFLAKVNSSLGVSLNTAERKITGEFGNTKLVESYAFRFKLPATLRIDLILKKPKYSLSRKNTNEIAILDDQGIVLEKVASTNLPYVISADNLPEIGQTVESQKSFALELIYGLYYMYQVKSGEIVGESLEVTIPEGEKVIFPLIGERDILLGSVKLILSQLNQDGNSFKMGKVKEIDLRYKNPVLRYN